MARSRQLLKEGRWNRAVAGSNPRQVGAWDIPTMPRLQSSLSADRLILTRQGIRVRSDSLPAGTEYILMQQDFELFQDGIGIVPCCLIRVQTDVWVAVKKALDNATRRQGEQF